MKNLTFKIAINGKNGKEIIYTVSLLELQTLQIKHIDFKYIVG